MCLHFEEYVSWPIRSLTHEASCMRFLPQWKPCSGPHHKLQEPNTVVNTSGFGTPWLVGLPAHWTWHAWSWSRAKMPHHGVAGGLVLPCSHSLSLVLPHYTSQWRIQEIKLCQEHLLSWTYLFIAYGSRQIAITSVQMNLFVPFSIISYPCLIQKLRFISKVFMCVRIHNILIMSSSAFS